MNNTRQKNRLYFFFSLICVFLLSVCFIRKYDGFHGEDAHFANYTLLGSDSNGLAYYCDEDDSSKIAVAIGSCTDQDIEVSEYNDKPVTEIYPSGFQNCSTIRTISLPDTVTVFGTDAFAGSSIESLTIPDGLTVISTGAFRNCKNLTTVTFKNTNQVITINDYAFANDFNLTSFPFHKISHLTTIGKEAFLYCIGLSSVFFPNSFTTLESYAFQDCKNLTTIYFPASITRIGSVAFKGVGESAKIYFSENRVQTVTDCNISDPNASTTIPFEYDNNFSFGDHYIPVVFDVGELKIVGPFTYSRPNDGVKELKKCVTDSNGNWGVTENTEYTETIASDEVIIMSYDDDGTTNLDIPATIEWDRTLKVVGINSDVFINNETITSVTFHENLRFIDYRAFSECSNLTSINLQGAIDLKHIQSRAFYATMPIRLVNGKFTTSTMYSVHIPANVENIAADAFRDCAGLCKVYFDGATSEYEETFICDGNTKDFELAYVPASISSVTDSGPQAAGYSCSGKIVTLTNKPKAKRVVKIKYTTNNTTTQSFVGHKDGGGNLVADYVLSSKVGAIASITVGGVAETNYTYSDYNEGKQTKITFAANHVPSDGETIVVSYRPISKLTKIDEYAFSGCFENLGGQSFYNLNLVYYDDPFQNVYFPASLNSIGEYAFANSQIVGGAIFNSSSLTIGGHAFYSEESLSSIVFPSEMTSLVLNNKSFGSGLAVNNYAAGSQYKKLISVTLPSNTTVSGNEVFAGHYLLSIYCIGNLPTITDSKDDWNKRGSMVITGFGDFSSEARKKDEMDYVPVYVVDSEADIISLPDKTHPIFDFVKEKGSNTATLTNYHYYGGRIKDRDGDTALKPGESLTTNDKTKINSLYDSEYAVQLTNGHFRAEVPAQVSFDGGNNYVAVTKIGKAALAGQINTSTLRPYEANASGTNTAKDACRYWLATENFWTMREINLPDSIIEISDAAIAFIPYTTLTSYVLSNAKLISSDHAMVWDSNKTVSSNGKFPSNLKILGGVACAYSGLTSASLPDRLEQFGRITENAEPDNDSFLSFPFMGCFDLAELSLYEAGANTDSGIFTHGGGVINYSGTNQMIEGAAGKNEITIPWRTEHTVAGALRGGRNIQTVHFPFTLREISNNFLDVIGSTRDSQGRAQTSALTTVTFENGSYSGYSSANVTDQEKADNCTSKCTSIGISAFWGNRNLLNVELPDSLIYLYDKAFKECNSLCNFTVDKGTSNTSPFAPIIDNDPDMGSHFNCNKLPNLTTISKECFYNCRGLEKVTTSSNIPTLGESAFSGCSGLTDVTIDGGTNTLKKTAFNGCTSLESVTFNSSATTASLEESCFKGCTSLTSVEFNRSVTLGATCFDGCTSLASIKIPAGSTVNNKAFNGCTGLASSGGGVFVEKTVKFANKAVTGSSAFIGCDAATKIFLKDTYAEYTGSHKTNYPTGWNVYSTTGGNQALEPYCYSENQPENPQSGFHYWEDEDGDGVPHIWC